MNLPICVDSGIVLKLYLEEEDSHLADALWNQWMETGFQPVAPILFPLEITAVLRKHVYRKTIELDYGLRSLRVALSLNVLLPVCPNIHQHAWDLATQLNRPTAYDAHYLALAQHLSCDFWTADRRLYNAAHRQFPWIHLLGDFKPIDN